VVHTYSGYENKVATNIEKMVENRKMQDQILETNPVTPLVFLITNHASSLIEGTLFSS